MGLNDREADALKPYCKAVATCAAGGVDYVLLTALQLPGCTPAEPDALLCLGDRGEGYPTRLFLSQRVTPPRPYALNWNANGVRILEREWWAFSWRVPAGMTPEETLAHHLGPLR